MTQYLNTKEASKVLGVTSATLIAYVNSGKIPGAFIARKFRFKASDIESYIDSQKRSR